MQKQSPELGDPSGCERVMMLKAVSSVLALTLLQALSYELTLLRE